MRERNTSVLPRSAPTIGHHWYHGDLDYIQLTIVSTHVHYYWSSLIPNLYIPLLIITIVHHHCYDFEDYLVSESLKIMTILELKGCIKQFWKIIDLWDIKPRGHPLLAPALERMRELT